MKTLHSTLAGLSLRSHEGALRGSTVALCCPRFPAGLRSGSVRRVRRTSAARHADRVLPRRAAVRRGVPVPVPR